MHRVVIPKSKNSSKTKEDGDEDQEIEEAAPETEKNDEADEDETSDEFVARVNLYVSVHIARAFGSKRDHYKDGLVYQTRKELINEFLKATILTRCQNADCHKPVSSGLYYSSQLKINCSYAYTFRKEGYTKVIEYDLSAKQKKQTFKKRPDVLLAEKRGTITLSNNDEQDDDVEMSGSESDDDGETVGPEDEDDDEDNSQKTNLPRAANGKVKTMRGRNERVMSAEECRAHLRRLFKNEIAMCALLYGKHGPFAKLNAQGLAIVSADMFFMEVVPVAPTRFRPPAKMNDTLFEHPQNELLAKVLNTSYRLRDLNIDLRSASQKSAEYDEATRRRLMSSLLETLIQLQVDVNSFMDSSKNPTPMRQGKLPPAGVKQGLEKKEGLFRKHMMVLHTLFPPFTCNDALSRENVSIMQLVLSSHPMSILNPTKLEYLPFLP